MWEIGLSRSLRGSLLRSAEAQQDDGKAIPSSSSGGGSSAGSSGSNSARAHAQRRVLAGHEPAPPDVVPWSTVQELLSMAHDALEAKQRAAEVLRAEAERCQERGSDSEAWSQRAQRAETDSGSLLAQLESLLQAKQAIASDRAELGRGISLLRAERELLCEQLQVDPATNLCRAVEAALAEARRAGVLEAQLRALARQRRQLRLELDAARGAGARHRAAWQAREAVLIRALADAGAPIPDLPPAPGSQASSSASGARAVKRSSRRARRRAAGDGGEGSGSESSGSDSEHTFDGDSSSPGSSSLAYRPQASDSRTLEDGTQASPSTPSAPRAPGTRRHRAAQPARAAAGGGAALAQRAMSLDGGLAAAAQLEGLEAVMERIARATPAAPCGAACGAGGAAGGAQEGEGCGSTGGVTPAAWRAAGAALGAAPGTAQSVARGSRLLAAAPGAASDKSGADSDSSGSSGAARGRAHVRARQAGDS